MKTRRSILVSFGSLTVLGLSVACASAPPPKELVDARAAYVRAQDGPAARLAPANLHDAKVALQRAEGSYSNDGDTAATRDYAYIAERKSELAEATADTTKARTDADAARSRAVATTQTELNQARQRLEREQSARREAEQRARDALNSLATVAANVAVKNDTRGTVITIPGSVLFASGKTNLLPGAKAKLDKVADALKDQTDRRIEINGYTDSVGSEAKNEKLSQDRADQVRDYLVSQGVPQTNVTAKGLGASDPIADNGTNSGRAMNRRVEIVVESDNGGNGGQSQSQSQKWRQGQNPDQGGEAR